MLSIENFELKSTIPNADENKQWWVFKHKYNPNKIEVVFRYCNGYFSGNKTLIETVKDYVDEKLYTPTKAFIKKRNDLVNRIQTNNIKKV